MADRAHIGNYEIFGIFSGFWWQHSREIIKFAAVRDAVIGQKYSHQSTAVHTLA